MELLLSLLVPLASILAALIIPMMMLRKMNRLERKYGPLAEDIQSITSIVGGLFTVKQDKEGNYMVSEGLEVIGGALGQGVAKSLKMSLMGELSGRARLDKGLAGAFVQDVIDKKAPILGILDNVLGTNTTDYLKKNPQAIMGLMPLIEKFAPGVIPGLLKGGAGQAVETAGRMFGR